jgi:hypothetical protein
MRHLSSATATLGLAAASFATACSITDSSGLDFGETVVTTAISIDLRDALGATPCSDEKGALRSYVATVYDHAGGTQIVTLPSSLPTPCSVGISFRYITPEHTYTADIDAYEARPDEIEPLGGATSGSRHMVPVGGGGGDIIPPRWTSSCGAATAKLHTNVRFSDCSPLEDNGTSSPVTAIVIDPSAALGDLRCASAGGEVTSFDILPETAGLPSITGYPCGTTPLTFNAGIEPGVLYRFRLEARALAGGPIVWGSSCFALAEDGLTAEASCDPIVSTGDIEVSIASLLESAGAKCGEDVATYEAVLAKPAVSVGPVACAEPARFGPLETGSYSIDVRTFNSKGEALQTATCEAMVAPGKTAQATCQ